MSLVWIFFLSENSKWQDIHSLLSTWFYSVMNTSFFCWRTGSTVKVATVEESKVYYVYPIKRVKAAIYLVWVEGRLDNWCKIRAIFGLMVTMVSVSLSVGLEVLNGDLEPRLPVERVFVGEGARYYLLHTDTHLIFWSRLCVFFLSLFLYNIARRGKENAVGPRDQLAFFFPCQTSERCCLPWRVFVKVGFPRRCELCSNFCLFHQHCDRVCGCVFEFWDIRGRRGQMNWIGFG